jgi:hypothetical protein
MPSACSFRHFSIHFCFCTHLFLGILLCHLAERARCLHHRDDDERRDARDHNIQLRAAQESAAEIVVVLCASLCSDCNVYASELAYLAVIVIYVVYQYCL